MGLVATAVRNGIDDGTLRADLDPAKTAVLLWAQSSGVLQAVATAGERIRAVHQIDPQDLVDTFFEFVFHAIAANPEDVLTRRTTQNDTESS